MGLFKRLDRSDMVRVARRRSRVRLLLASRGLPIDDKYGRSSCKVDLCMILIQ